ncbi:MAG TPA: Gfo/Idh/MocA family oxidoreductase [Thermomicrobiales bacterium]|nr:Gfo/Idh/MocA family oxidoreductase [Thermomicrobiales bacterium]
MTLKVAVIGAGRRGMAHTEAVADLEHQAQVVAIADVDQQRAASLIAASAPYAQPHADGLEMLRETEPEVVFITTPPPLHREQTIAALEVGAHVVLEKPIALTVEDAEAIGEAAAKADRLVHVCHQIRYAPGALDLRDLLVGRPVALTHIWNYRKAPDIPGNWSRAWGGGHVVEWGIHYLDLCRYLMQTEAVEVYARYADQVLHGQDGWDNWDAYSLTVQWANGAVCGYASTYALASGIPPSSGLAIVAGGGKAEMSWLDFTWTTLDETKTWPAQRGDGERALASAFFDAVTTGDASNLRQSFDDALRTHRLVLAANQSAVSGKPVRLS